ncbi:MAG: type II toxin-antitoxin system VapC family toxin [Alphaproteobacteria bacterium]
MLLLDTHVWVWQMSASTELAPASRNAINHAASLGMLRIAAISIWETALLASRRRIMLLKPTAQWVEEALIAPGLSLEPLSPRIAIESCDLPGRFHNDPADRIIVATARVTDAILMTRDRRILDYAALGHLAALPA